MEEKRQVQQWEQAARPGVFASLLALFEGRRGTILALLLAPLLIVLALWLPPLSVGDRVFDAGYTPVARTGSSFTDPDGTELIIPEEALQGNAKVQFVSASRQSFFEGSAGGILRDAPAALPSNLIIKSPVYVAGVRGTMPAFSSWVLPIPNDSEPYRLLDLYGWDGSRWGWLPHRLWAEDEQIETTVTGVPLAVAVMQAQALPPQVAALADENPDFINRAGPVLSVLSPRLFLLQGDGNVGQLFTLSPIFNQSGALVQPVLHNLEPTGVVRSDLVDNLLIDPAAWRAHVDRIESLLVSSPYDGIVLDYRGVDPLLREQFSSFVALLGERLAARGKTLTVRVGEPVRVSEDEFDTGAYDWRVIGQAATTLRLPLPRRAGLYGGTDDLEALLTYATGQVNRYRLDVELPAAPYIVEAGSAQPLPYDELLDELGVEASDLTLEGLASLEGVQHDPATGAYQLAREGQPVVIENSATFAERLERIGAFNVGGVVVDYADQADPAIWNVLATYQSAILP